MTVYPSPPLSDPSLRVYRTGLLPGGQRQDTGREELVAGLPGGGHGYPRTIRPGLDTLEAAGDPLVSRR